MRTLPPLGSLRAFEAAARRESFKLAAEELAVTPTAISHQIYQLEDHLGVALFLRQTRRVTLTEDGRRLYPTIRDAFDAMAVAVKALKKPLLSRQAATLSATVAFTAKRLVPHAASFRMVNPAGTCAFTPAMSRSIFMVARLTRQSVMGSAVIQGW